MTKSSSSSSAQGSLKPWRQRRRSLMDVLIPYDTRKEVLSWLSAFDIAKLDLVLEYILDQTERQVYLNPVRDIIWNKSLMNALVLEGMKLILCGNDVPLLHQRLHDTKSYLQAHGHKRRLQIYLVGLCPFPEDMALANDRILSFSVGKDRCDDRIWNDRRELERMLQVFSVYSLSSSAGFLMSFGTPIQKLIRPSASTWYPEPDLPDRMIDLKIYVPSYSARLHGEVSLPRSVIPGLFGFAYRKTCLLRLFTMYTRIVTNKVQLPHISYLTPTGLRDPRKESEEGTMRFHFGPSLLFREFSI
ncbi:hypothetical protein P154DRAFT_10817 [Amniculicola lignicola CBS 123094]|uniref:Uncharacterized protein n=1 Tax=Amniculicola lignicola CBS 123094 TaxID=1392246 RepID=A0A6A5X4I1_9PLEO|nr:hypothetical protein P154DRAFT_10817 [Amniculicola lignicola CBS 123094]